MPSWEWYFPYHHAPLLGDLAALLRSAPASLAAPWPPSRPLKPFEQLMAVLPPSSGLTALPPQYAELMRVASAPGSTHPLRACFPHAYRIQPDPSGREWRDVALIPFIDVPALQRHMALAGPLAPKHAAGQAFGPALAFAFDPSQKGSLASPMPRRFPPLTPAASVELKVGGAPPRAAPRVDGQPPQCPPPLAPLRGWPTLQLPSPFTMQLLKAGLQLECLGVTARGESWVLQLAGRHGLGPTEPLVRRAVLGGESVWVGWPHCREARVVCVSTAASRHWRDR